MAGKTEEVLMEAQQSSVPPHQPGPTGFRAILSEDDATETFAAFPPARLAVRSSYVAARIIKSTTGAGSSGASG